MTGQTAESRSRVGTRWLLAVAGPVVVVAAAYGLWWVSDRLVVVGPLDRASFGWLIVIPTWLAAPIVAGFTWRGLDRRALAGAAIAVGAIIGTVAALLFWQAVVGMDCTYRATHTAAEWIAPSLILGAAIGATPALGGLAVAPFMRDRRVLAGVVIGMGAALLMTLLVIVVAGVTLLAGPGCQRPPV